MMKYKMMGLNMVQAKKMTFGLLKPGKLVDVTTLMFRRPLTPKMHLGDYYGYFIAVVPLLFFVSSFINHLFSLKCSFDVLVFLYYIF